MLFCAIVPHLSELINRVPTRAPNLNGSNLPSSRPVDASNQQEIQGSPHES